MLNFYKFKLLIFLPPVLILPVLLASLLLTPIAVNA